MIRMLAFVSVVSLLAPVALAREPEFKARGLVAISDGDMLPAAYAGGDFGPAVGGDAMTVIDLRRGLAVARPAELPVSNSVAGAPGALALTPDARVAFVAESRARPKPGDRTFSDLGAGKVVTAVDLSDLAKPRVAGTTTLDREPDTLSVSADGRWLAITLSRQSREDRGGQIALAPINGASLGTPIRLTLPDVQDTAFPSAVFFHTTRKSLAAVFPSENQVRFYDLADGDAGPVLKPWGNPVTTGKYPYTGRFTPDGRHFLVAELEWGPDVPGFSAEAPVGGIAMIRLGDGTTTHARVARVEGAVSPEGVEISPDGRFALTVSLMGSWLPEDDPFYTPYAAATLLGIDAQRSRLEKLDEVLFHGTLPEGAAFDQTSRNVLITAFSIPGKPAAPALLKHYRIVETPRGVRLSPTDADIPLRRGVHLVLPLPGE